MYVLCAVAYIARTDSNSSIQMTFIIGESFVYSRRICNE